MLKERMQKSKLHFSRKKFAQLQEGQAVLGAGLALLGAVFFFPVLLRGRAAEPESAVQQTPPAAEETASAAQLPAGETVVETAAPAETAALLDSGQTIRLRLNDGSVAELTLHDYLWGVVAAEMPASFELEALKAQAVAARTETLYHAACGVANHPEADVCADITCCQAYLSVEEATARWGDAAGDYGGKITAAVEETDGLVVKYDGEIIQALFHSSSAGHTRSAEEVWGGQVPYLQEVDSPEGEDVPNYYSVVALTEEEFRQTFLGAYPNAQLEGTPDRWQVEPVYTDSGTLLEMNIGGVTAQAGDLRTLFGLRSASFSLECTGEGVTFYVTGYGHGVGMSQYGANQLAKEGYGFADILTWYYIGTEVSVYS